MRRPTQVNHVGLSVPTLYLRNTARPWVRAGSPPRRLSALAALLLGLPALPACAGRSAPYTPLDVPDLDDICDQAAEQTPPRVAEGPNCCCSDRLVRPLPVHPSEIRARIERDPNAWKPAGAGRRRGRPITVPV